MTSERQRPAAEAGFTLIEVLVAMLVLAVGLLGLEALAIGAARSIAQADRQSEFTLAASRAMEDRILEIRRTAPAVSTAESCRPDEALRYQICSRVETRAELPALPERTARVTVSVREGGEGTVRFNLVSHVFDSRLPSGP